MDGGSVLTHESQRKNLMVCVNYRTHEIKNQRFLKGLWLKGSCGLNRFAWIMGMLCFKILITKKEFDGLPYITEHMR